MDTEDEYMQQQTLFYPLECRLLSIAGCCCVFVYPFIVKSAIDSCISTQIHARCFIK